MKKNKIEIYKAFVGLSAFSSNGLSLVISNSSDSLYWLRLNNQNYEKNNSSIGSAGWAYKI